MEAVREASGGGGALRADVARVAPQWRIDGTSQGQWWVEQSVKVAVGQQESENEEEVQAQYNACERSHGG